MKVEDTDFSNSIKKVTWDLEDVIIEPYLVVTASTFYSYVDILDKTNRELVTKKHVHPVGVDYNTSTISELYSATVQMKKQTTLSFTPITKLRVRSFSSFKGKVLSLFAKAVNCLYYKTCNYVPSPVSNTYLVN